ncbi:MAG: hypothetical protein CMJ62_21305 [Planctomycetaceae bacterium]|nr:hypothetical protein [Planctomycetaceae bacterium]|tara:strand:+ start:3637 stop:3981 length:345 start_codon:yes stop_codon:yes gene_type:complete
MTKSNSINVGSMQNSQIQQDTTNSTQKLQQSDFDSDIREFLQSFIPEISKIADEPTARLLSADAETIARQMDSPSPKKSVIKECLSSIRNVLEGAAGSVLASHLPAVCSLLACL